MLQGQAIAHGVSNESARKALFGSFSVPPWRPTIFSYTEVLPVSFLTSFFFRVPIRLLGPCWLSQPLQ